MPGCIFWLSADVLSAASNVKVDVKWDACSAQWTGGFQGTVALFGDLLLNCKLDLPSAQLLGTAEITLAPDDHFSLHVRFPDLSGMLLQNSHVCAM